MTICAHCGKRLSLPTGHVNRAKKIGARLFCDRRCFGLSRRLGKSVADKKREKSEYDRIRRTEKRAEIKAKKAAYFKATYDPKAAAIERKNRMPKHVEYCRRPEYRAYKSNYDREHRAKKQFGEYWESALLLGQIETTIAKQASRYEIMLTNETLNKAQRRRRDYERSDRKQP